jgi:hypothetical protein
MGIFDMKQNQSGQIALEFMLLLVFILMFVSAVVLPNVEFAGNATQEIERMGQARIAAEKIASVVERLEHQSVEAKQTVIVFVPKDTNLLCDQENRKIGFEAGLQSGPASSCENDSDRVQPGSNFICTKWFETHADLTCTPSVPSDSLWIEGKQSVIIAITKAPSGTMVNAQ